MMKPRRGFYSLVQYCPDRSRLEAVNVGVILSVPDLAFLAARMDRQCRRAKRLFGREGLDERWLKKVMRSLEMRLQVPKPSLSSIEQFNQFAATRANQITLTEPRPLKVTSEPAAELASLFSELVDTERIGRRKPEIPELDLAFRGPALKGRIRFDQEVEVPVVKRKLTIPYAYQNAREHLVMPVRFSSKPLDHGMQLAAEGDLLQRESSSKPKVILVPEVTPAAAAKDTRGVLSRLFATYELAVVWEEERAAFIAEVKREAH